MKNRKIKSLALIALLTVGTLAQTACGNSTTLDRVGIVGKGIAQAVEDQYLALKAAGASDAKLAPIKRAVDLLKATTTTLDERLQALKIVDEKSAAEILGYSAQTAAIIGGLLQNPDVLGLGEKSAFVQILRWGSIVAQQLSVTLRAFFPPPPAGALVAASGSGKSVSARKIKIVSVEPPAEMAKYLK